MSAPKPRLDVDATRERLLALGCGYAADRLGDLLGEAVRAETAPHAFLEQLLAAELSGREERRVKTSLKVSRRSRPSPFRMRDRRDREER